MSKQNSEKKQFATIEQFIEAWMTSEFVEDVQTKLSKQGIETTLDSLECRASRVRTKYGVELKSLKRKDRENKRTKVTTQDVKALIAKHSK